ncbi:MAG TPA: cytochrome D1 domain-containing protein, partial [Thermohalobaculum sp.]|nr:cytochrome D1 domain-containing protein [Thermohalobaculum sp.]
MAGLPLLPGLALAAELRGTGDMGLVIERATGSVLIVDQSDRAAIGRIEGLGDLSHASVVYSPDERYAYVFGRDGGLTKLDILEQSIAGRVVQGGNSIGGAISDDGTLVAVSNYEPGGVRVFDAGTLEMVADIPAEWSGGLSKTIGLVDAPGRRFVFTLWDAGETWIADFSGGGAPAVTRIAGMGDHPYDALITADGRHYIAGLFGEDGLTALDLWQSPPVPRRILAGSGMGEEKLPVYKMP